jgi:D-3-phosphoglycerate dehydrogenase / 2-oxoglutarate reductase
MPKVLISDSLSPAAVKIFQERGVEVEQKTGLKPEELREIIDQYDGLAIRSNTKVTKEILAAATKLRVVGRAGIGVDNVDVTVATARGVVVMNTPFGNSITTAEHALAMLFAVARQIPQANASTHAGKWEKNRFMGVELCNKVLGIIGCGNIGAIVADRALGLKMRVVAFDPFLSTERAQQLGVEKLELDELLRRADFITLHTPLTEQTKGILDAAALAKCKRGVRIINCARGGLVVEDDLKAALESGQVAAAGMDVFAVEPAQSNPLFGMSNVICTPHLGAATTEAQENVALQVAEQISDFLLSGAVTNALNMPSVSAEDAPKLRPYLKLAEQLGSLAGQTVATGVKSVTIEYDGHVAGLNTRPLTAAALTGLLQPLLTSVNMVNAPAIARERNIAVSETRHERATDYQTVMRVIVESESGRRSVKGTLIAGEKPRIIGVDEVAIEAELAPLMLFVLNQDQPGFIGRIGTKLGQAGINIANFNLGRDQAGGQALSLIAIDSAISPALLEEINKLPSVIRAIMLKF